MKKAVLAVLIAAFVTAVIYVVPINGETEIYNKVVRLHVIANSDSEEDQALKLAVRDAILEKVSSATENCSSREEAENVHPMLDITYAMILSSKSMSLILFLFAMSFTTTDEKASDRYTLDAFSL